MTKVVCFFASNLRPETSISVIAYAPGAEFVDCSSDNFAYWKAFRERWNSGEDLVVIEQDNEIRADTIAQLDACQQHWCTFPYRVVSQSGIDGVAAESLGCTRFSAELQSKVKARHISQDDYRHWRQLASRVSVTLTRYGYRPHLHGTLNHYHDESDYRTREHRGEEGRARALQSEEFKLNAQPPAPNYWDARFGND